jgi:hypothetical protein
MEFISTIRKSLPCFCYSYPSDPEAEDSRGQGKRVRSFPEHHGKPGRLHDPDVYPCIMRSPPRRPGTAVAVHARSQLPGHFQRTAVGMSTTCCYTPGDLDIFTPVNARNRTWIGVCREGSPQRLPFAHAVSAGTDCMDRTCCCHGQGMETSHARCASLRRGLSRAATLAMVNGLQV